MVTKRLSVPILLSILLILCISSGFVTAYLSTTTDEKSNVFTPSDYIKAKLTEPNWKESQGLKLVPGKVTRKDPQITNTGTTSEYVAIRITFRYSTGEIMTNADLLRLLNLIQINWNSKWKLYDGIMTSNTSGITAVTQPLTFYYEDVLPPHVTSEPIFHSIRVKDQSDGLTEDDLRWLQKQKIINGFIAPDLNGGIGRFRITVEGSAIQASAFSNAEEAKDDLKTLLPTA